ncbi:MAG: glycosyltransferase family 4 protein [Acidobacteria bacterium]|nr:glycosyltransferase family 4 protein [Acidobacteriota bacterium]
MKRILLVSNEVMHYRVSVYNDFAKRFRERGYELLVRANRLQEKNPHPIGFDFRVLPFRFSLYRKEIRALDPDVVILFLHIKDVILFPLLYWLRLCGRPVLVWTKGANLDAPEQRLRNAVFHHMQTLANGLILYSPQETRFVRRKNRPKITYANNTINYREFPAIAASREDIKKEFGVPFKKTALFVGRMDVGGGRKKPVHAIRVFNAIANPDYGLLLVGSGYSDRLEGEIRGRNVMYLGEVYDPENIGICKIFKMADVFLMPGHVGLGLNQAFVLGLPVITEKGPQPPEIHYLVSGRNGFLVEENDLDDLRSKVLRLLDDDEERARFAENARRDILANASIEGMFQGFLQNIERVLDRA